MEINFLARAAALYAGCMDPEGVTPWYAILILFAYAGAGWAVFAGIYIWLRRRRAAPTARVAALGYGESWRSNSQSNF